MGYYDTMQVCLRGHKITSNASRTVHREEYCQKCGAKTITQCPQCKANIRGSYESDGVVIIGSDRIPVPLNCHHCGASYPWRRRLRVEAYLKWPKWSKVFIKWLGDNLLKVVIAVAVAVISGAVLYKLGFRK